MTMTTNDYLFKAGAGYYVTLTRIRVYTTVYLPVNPETGYREVFHDTEVWFSPANPPSCLHVIQDQRGEAICPKVWGRSALDAAKYWWSTTSWNSRNIWSLAGKATNDDLEPKVQG